MTEEKCPICARSCKVDFYIERNGEDGVIVECVRCGEFSYSDEVKQDIDRFIETLSTQTRINISSFLHENKAYHINTKNIDFVKNIQTATILEKIKKLMTILEKMSLHIGSMININLEDLSIQAKTWTMNNIELFELFNYIINKSFIDETPSRLTQKSFTGKISINGWSYLEELNKQREESTQGFVAMWFDSTMEEIYNSTMPHAIRNAGYTPYIANQIENIDKIDDEIIAQIRRSKFVIADFTGHRQNVYYEAGYAHGREIPVIMTCREDQANTFYFDIRQYNYLSWTSDNLEDFSKRLSNRIEAVFGRGPVIQQA